LGELLDRLDEAARSPQVGVGTLAETLGQRSFAALMLVFALISTSPASAIPGLTTGVAAIECLLALQLIAGRRSAWLPAFISDRQLPGRRLREAVRWLRKPLAAVERIIRPRFAFMAHRPWLYLPLLLVVLLTLSMPVMEFVPTSGSMPSALIALFAAGLIVHDGLVILLVTALLLVAPVAVFFMWPA
jgi:hypothetical protein